MAITKRELTPIASAIRTILGDMLGHGQVEQCDALGSDSRGTLRLELVVRPQAAVRLARLLATDALSLAVRERALGSAAFGSMVRECLATLAEHGIDPHSVESWDGAFVEPEWLPVASAHAIGFIAGAAAALDVTPLELVDLTRLS